MDGFDGELNAPEDIDMHGGLVDAADLAPTEEFDLDDDGEIDSLLFDLGHGTALLTDMDGDGGADTIAVDTVGDGSADVIIQETSEGYVVTDYTTGGEVTVLSREEMALQAPDLLAALDHSFIADGATGDDAPVADPQPAAPVEDQGWSVEDGRFIGDPVGDAEHWFQQAQNGFCLPASIAQIVAEYTGTPFADETVFIDIANELGAFQVGYDGVPGIPFDKGVDILQEAGVPAELGFGSLESLAVHLSEGYNIIAFVDSGELWTGEGQEDWQPDHAVVITGVDVERGTVILSDPGRPGGNLSEYPVDLFMNAWADSENAWIVADQPPADAVDPMDTTPADAAPGETIPADTGSGVEAQGPVTGTALDPTPDLPTAAPAAQDTELDVTGMLRSQWGEGLPQTEEEGLIERTTSWAMRNPWILIPVVLGARELVNRANKEQ